LKAIEILSIVSISLFCLLGLFLISKEKARLKGFAWLGTFFLLLAINFLDGALLLNGFYLSFPWMVFWEDPFALLYGPLIYFFVLRITSKTIYQNYAMLLHCLPFLTLEILVALFHLNYSNEQIREIIVQITSQNLDLQSFLSIVPFFIHVIGYILFAQRTLMKHRADLMQYYSLLEITWAFSLIRMIVLIFLFSLIITFVQYLGTMEFYSIALLFMIIISIFLTTKILFFAMNQPILQSTFQPVLSFKLSKEAEENLRKRINVILSEKKVFTDSNISLKTMAEHLGAKERAVSYVINHTMAENFYDLINIFRIQEAQEILKNSTDAKLTILEVLYQVGFTSKSSFNTQFKKKTGMTPRAYRKLHQNV